MKKTLILTVGIIFAISLSGCGSNGSMTGTMALSGNLCKNLGVICAYERGEGEGVVVAENNGDIDIDESIPGVEISVQDIMDEYGLTEEDASTIKDLIDDVMDVGFTEEEAVAMVQPDIRQLQGETLPTIADSVSDNNQGDSSPSGSGTSPSDSGSSASQGSGSSSGSEPERDGTRTPDEGYAEEGESGFSGPSSFGDVQGIPLTDEERAAEEAVWDTVHGY